MALKAAAGNVRDGGVYNVTMIGGGGGGAVV